jgi:hypothetical protein
MQYQCIALQRIKKECALVWFMGVFHFRGMKEIAGAARYLIVPVNQLEKITRFSPCAICVDSFGL